MFINVRERVSYFIGKKGYECIEKCQLDKIEMTIFHAGFNARDDTKPCHVGIAVGRQIKLNSKYGHV